MLYMYDPCINLKTETSYDYLVELTGKKKSTLMSLKSRGLKIRSINVYLIDETTTLQQRKAWYEKEKYKNEYWVPVKGSDGKFLISNYARFKRVYKNKEGFLMPYYRKASGHMEIRVKFKGVYKQYQVPHLVAAHFIGNPKPGEVIRHRNGILTDDNANNLEFVDKRRLGKLTGYSAKSKEVVQLDPKTLEVIQEFRSAREAGRKTYRSYQAVIDNCNKRTKTSSGDRFMWAEEYELMNL